MSVAKSIEKLKSFEIEFEQFGQSLLEEYPGSQVMLEFSTSFDILSQSLREFRESMEAAVNQASIEITMKKDLLDKIQEHELFGELSKATQDRLAEYLIETHLGLWTREEFITFLIDKHKEKTNEEIIAELPKVFVMEIGRSVQTGEGDSGKTLLTLGIEAIHQMLKDPEQKARLLKEHVEKVVNKSPVKALEYVFQDLPKVKDL